MGEGLGLVLILVALLGTLLMILRPPTERARVAVVAGLAVGIIAGAGTRLITGSVWWTAIVATGFLEGVLILWYVRRKDAHHADRQPGLR